MSQSEPSDGIVGDVDLDALNAAWAEQGLYTDPIKQEGYLSFAGAIPEHVDVEAILEALEAKRSR